MPPLLSINDFQRWFWPILAFALNMVGFQLLDKNPHFMEIIGAKQENWPVNALWSAAQHLVSFLLICNLLFSPQIRDKCKKSLLLNVVLNYICLAVPAVMGHLAEYPNFHIRVNNQVEQHNSRKINDLFTACVFAVTSWGLSKTYHLSFDCGFFSACLGYSMMVSLAIVDKTGKSRDIGYGLGTFIFCFIVILCRKYLEIDHEGSDTARQRDDHSSNDRNTDTAGQSPSASRTIDLQASQTESSGGWALNQPTEATEADLRICENRTLAGNDGRSVRDARQESWDVDEHQSDNVPPRIDIDTSSSYGDAEDGDEDVPRVSKCVVIEGKDIVMTQACFDEGTSGIDDCVGEKEEVSGQENSHEEQGDMRATTSSGDMEIIGSFESGACEEDSVPILLPKSNIIIEGETQIVNVDLGQIERSVGQSQEDGFQDHEKDDDPFLLPKSSLKVDKNDDDSDNDSSNDEGSDGDGFHSRTGCKLGVGQDLDVEEESLKVDKDDDDDDGDCDSSDEKGSDDDDFSNGTGCSLGVGRDQGGRNMQPLRTNMWEIANCSNLGEEDVPFLLTQSKNEREIGHDEPGDTKSSTSSGHMGIAGSFGSRAYEEDDVPLLLPKNDNMIEGKSHIWNVLLGQMGSLYQSQGGGSQGHEKDNNLLLPKNSVKIDDDDGVGKGRNQEEGNMQRTLEIVSASNFGEEEMAPLVSIYDDVEVSRGSAWTGEDNQKHLRQRHDDKWEHDLFDDDEPRISNHILIAQDLRLKLQKKGLKPTAQSGKSSLRDLCYPCESLSRAIVTQPKKSDPPSPKVEVSKSAIIEPPVSRTIRAANPAPKKMASPKVDLTALTYVIDDEPKATGIPMVVPSVDGFLHSLGLNKYLINFQAEEVDMAALTNMTDDDLKTMGIPMGPRKKILLALD